MTSSSNFIDMRVADEELRRHSRYHALALLYWNRVQRDKALKIWQELGNGTIREIADNMEESNVMRDGERDDRTLESGFRGFERG